MAQPGQTSPRWYHYDGQGNLATVSRRGRAPSSTQPPLDPRYRCLDNPRPLRASSGRKKPSRVCYPTEAQGNISDDHATPGPSIGP
jgi:hypothetical protein